MSSELGAPNVAPPNPASPKNVASPNQAPPEIVALRNLASPEKVALLNVAPPENVAPSNVAVPENVASPNPAVPENVATDIAVSHSWLVHLPRQSRADAVMLRTLVRTRRPQAETVPGGGGEVVPRATNLCLVRIARSPP